MPAVETVPIIQQSFAPAFLQNKAFKEFLNALLTFLLINVTWVFFRAQDFHAAWRMLQSMFGPVRNDAAAVLPTINIIKVAVIVSLMFLTHWFMRNTSAFQVAQKMKWWLFGSIWAFMLILLILSQESSGSFIYSQF
ncbi:MAG: hypothetical protein C4330_08895 [Chitinophagaceae bacterium]